jgi:hypothetical protein
MGNDEGRPLNPLDNIGHGKGLSRACYSQEGLAWIARIQPCHQFLDGLGLIPGGDVICNKFKRVFSHILIFARTQPGFKLYIETTKKEL